MEDLLSPICFFVLLCVHVSWLNMCVDMNVLVCICIYACVWRQKVYLRYHSSKPSLFVTQGLLLRPRACQLS